MVVAARNIRMVCTGCSGTAYIWSTCQQVRNVAECWRVHFLQRVQGVHHDGEAIGPILHELTNFGTVQHCLNNAFIRFPVQHSFENILVSIIR